MSTDVKPLEVYTKNIKYLEVYTRYVIESSILVFCVLISWLKKQLYDLSDQQRSFKK